MRRHGPVNIINPVCPLLLNVWSDPSSRTSSFDVVQLHRVLEILRRGCRLVPGLSYDLRSLLWYDFRNTALAFLRIQVYRTLWVDQGLVHWINVNRLTKLALWMVDPASPNGLPLVVLVIRRRV